MKNQNRKLAEDIFKDPPPELRDRIQLLKIARNILGWGAGFQYLTNMELEELINRQQTGIKRRRK